MEKSAIAASIARHQPMFPRLHLMPQIVIRLAVPFADVMHRAFDALAHIEKIFDLLKRPIFWK